MKNLFFIISLFLFQGVVLGNHLDTIPTVIDRDPIRTHEMNGLVSPNPTAGIQQMEAPSANAYGTLALDYPLELPDGRNDMTPELSISYNHESGGGWLGLGWDLGVSSISIDTRWGVPRYDNATETETYLYDGNMLSPVAHRSFAEARSAEKVFHERVEQDFKKIIRHGDAPTNYWWEITDKSGRQYFYGGSPTTGFDANATLTTDVGNIAQWNISEIRDVYDNSIKYIYDQVSDSGVVGSSVPGKNSYLKEIYYAGKGTELGKYKIECIRDRDLGETRKPDVRMDFSFGFKQVDVDLLRKVEITYEDQIIRSYELQYMPGTFSKTLLKELIVNDREGVEFYRHDFEYYNDVSAGSSLNIFGDQENWTVPSDDLEGPLVTGIDGFSDDLTVLGSTSSLSGTVGGAVLFGLLGSPTLKENTIGGNYHFTTGSGLGRTTLVDINGDNLPDKVFELEGQLYYRANIANGSGNEFGPLHSITGASSFTNFKMKSHAVGGEVNLAAAFAGYEHAIDNTKIETYLMDFNGDGLVDIAHKGLVRFNHLDDDGHPTFSPSSVDTPSPIIFNSGIDYTIIEVDPNLQETRIDENPLHDVVRVWLAPYDGEVSITAPLSLVEIPEAEEYEKNDGVRVAVQVRGDEIWTTTIARDDFSTKTPTGVNNISVSRGDRIYFRLGSVFDGAYDLVEWDPIIRYNNENLNELDVNQNLAYEFQASKDFLTASYQTTSMPNTGTFEIKSLFQKPLTTDDLTLVVRFENTNTIIFQQTVAFDEMFNDSLNVSNIAVTEGDVLAVSIFSSTNVDWDAISWNPVINYTSIAGQTGTPNSTFCPSVDYRMYNEVHVKTDYYEAPATENLTVEVTPDIFIDFTDFQGGLVTLSVKGKEKLYGKTSGYFAPPILSEELSLDIATEQGDSLYIEFHVDNALLADRFNNTEVLIIDEADETTQFDAGLHAALAVQDSVMGPVYRRWGQFIYNGNRDRATMPMDETEMNVDVDDLVDLDLLDEDELSEDQINGIGSPAGAPFLPMYADAKTSSWNGLDEFTFTTDSLMSASRFGEDDIIVSFPGADGGTGIPAPIIEYDAVSDALAAGVGVGIAATGSVAFGTTRNVLDLADLNGDSYPDIVTDNHVQYTNPTGGLDEAASYHGLGTHTAKSGGIGGSLGGSFVSTAANTAGGTNGAGSNKSKARKKVKLCISGGRAIDSTEGAKSGMGLSGSYGEDRDSVLVTWIDINGDGLDDCLNSGGAVYLNTGRGFTSQAEQWDFNEISTGLTLDYGAGAGFNIYNGSITGGVSVNRSESMPEAGFLDLNGDGLVDYYRMEDEVVTVWMNTGTGFGSGMTLNNVTGFEQGNATGESANAAFTVCLNIPLPWPPFGFRICFNPNGSLANGISQQVNQISDVDGDGFPDFVQSTKDNELIVRRSLIGNSNLLKKVNTPFGASYTMQYANGPNSYEVPLSKTVFSELTIDDGTPGDGSNVSKSLLSYSGGRFDRHERVFYGYGSVLTEEVDPGNNDALYRSIDLAFNPENFYSKGLIQAQEIRDADDKILSRTTYDYAFKNPETGTELSTTDLKQGYGRAFPALLEQQTLFYEGADDPGLSASVTFEYDAVGNYSKITDLADGQVANQSWTSYDYHQLLDKNVLDVPSSVKIISPDGVLRQTEISINDFGAVTQVRKYLADGESANYDFQLDEFGNITQLTRPANEAGQRMSFDYVYDEQGLFVNSITDSYGLVNSFEYDPFSGEILKITDANGFETIYTIDKHNRLESITAPYEIESGAPYSIFFEYHPEAATPYALARHYDPEHQGDITLYTFADGLGREVQYKKTASIANANGAAQSQMIVSGLTTFDAFGRVTAAYFPSTEAIGAGNGSYNTNADNVAPTTYTYDALDRLLSVTKPSGSTKTFDYDIANDLMGNISLRTSITNSFGNTTEQYFDEGDDLVAIKVNSPAGEVWTQYERDALGQIIGETDQLGNSTSSGFDQLGRKIKIAYPDAGLTELEYDLNDNLTQRITSNIREILPDDVDGAIRYTYDFERLQAIDYPKNFQNKVQLHYGEPGAAFNRAGKVWLQEDASGGQEFFYGANGEVEKTIRTILISESNVQTYITATKYDSWNRIQSLIYPDGEQVDFEYNQGGKLVGMSGEKTEKKYDYLTGIGYDKFEDRVYLDYGNEVNSRYNYDPLRRKLKGLEVSGAHGKVADYFFDYDSESNLIRSENVAATLADQIGGGAKQSFEYDELSRLESASGSWQGMGREESYQVQMEYNVLDQISFKSQTHMRNGMAMPENTFAWEFKYENPEKPHNPSRIGARDIDYDPNGNLKIWNSTTSFSYQQHLWDEESRLLGTSLNGKISQFTYDAYGERSIKSHGDLQGLFVDGAPAGVINHFENYTAYVNPYFTVMENEFHKHYFIEGERFLTKRGVGQFDFNLISDQGIAAGGINYAERTQLLRADIEAYYAELGVPPGPPSLMGLYGQPEVNASSLPNATPDNEYGLPPTNWPSIPQPDSLGAPGIPVFYPIPPTNANVQPGYGFLGNPVIPEIDCSYYHYDGVGNVTNISDFNARLRQHIAYFPSGEIWIEEDTLVATQPYLYAGREYDRVSGLTYFGDRYYDGNHSLWQSPDPALQDFGAKTLDQRANGKQFYTYAGPKQGASAGQGVAAGAAALVSPTTGKVVAVSDEDVKKLKNVKKGFRALRNGVSKIASYLGGKIDRLRHPEKYRKLKNRKFQIKPNNPESQAVASQALADIKNFYRKQSLSPADDEQTLALRRGIKQKLSRARTAARKKKGKAKASGPKTRLRG